LKAATVEEIVEVPGIGRRTAEVILETLNAEGGSTPNGNGSVKQGA
jgi:excinuclease ABC subunit C